MLRRPGQLGPHVSLLAGASGRPVNTRVYGLQGFDAATVLATAINVGLQGAVAGFWVRALHWVTSQPADANLRWFASAFNAAGTGYRSFTSAGNTSIDFSPIFTGIVTVSAPTKAIVAGMVLKLIDTVHVWDQPNGRVRQYYQGVEVGAGTPTGLAYLPNAGQRFAEGSRSNGQFPSDANAIVGLEGGDAFVPSAAEIAAAHAATRALLAAGQPPLAGIAGKTTWRGQLIQDGLWNPPVVIVDTIGGNNLTVITANPASLNVATLNPFAWAP